MLFYCTVGPGSTGSLRRSHRRRVSSPLHCCFLEHGRPYPSLAVDLVGWLSISTKPMKDAVAVCGLGAVCMADLYNDSDAIICGRSIQQRHTLGIDLAIGEPFLSTWKNYRAKLVHQHRPWRGPQTLARYEAAEAGDQTASLQTPDGRLGTPSPPPPRRKAEAGGWVGKISKGGRDCGGVILVMSMRRFFRNSNFILKIFDLFSIFYYYFFRFLAKNQFIFVLPKIFEFFQRKICENKVILIFFRTSPNPPPHSPKNEK